MAIWRLKNWLKRFPGSAMLLLLVMEWSRERTMRGKNKKNEKMGMGTTTNNTTG